MLDVQWDAWEDLVEIPESLCAVVSVMEESLSLQALVPF